MTYEAFTPKTDVEEFLDSSFNVSVFEQLTEDSEWQGIFEPLAFFNLFYTLLDFIAATKHKPITVINHLCGLPLSDRQRYYLLNCIEELWLTNLKELIDDKQLYHCHGFISKERSKLRNQLYPPAPRKEKPRTLYNFNAVKRHLETLPTTEEKVRYLIEVRTEYLQNKTPLDDIGPGPSFDQQCQLEIEKLDMLVSLEKGV